MISWRLSLLSCFAAMPWIRAAEVHVHSMGESPISSAVAAASAGDHLVIEPGVYRERVVVDKTLTISGQEGAILDGSAPMKVAWSAAGGDLEGVYVAEVKGRPYGLMTDGKLMAEMRFDRAQKEGEWHWRTLLRRGPPLSGFEQIRALWIYHPKEMRVYARFENAAAPEKLSLTLIDSYEPLIRVSKATAVVLEGLTLRGGTTAISLQDDATGCVVRRCRVLSYESRGILLTKGASRCVVEDCEISRGSLEEWKPSSEHRRTNYEIWRIHKDVGNYDRVGIELIRAGVGNRILRNRLDRVFDGICLGDYKAESLDQPAADPEHGRGTEIAENVIENTRDSGIELGVGCVDVNVHHNMLRQTHGGLRFKVPRVGPVFIHHNRLINGAPFNIWFSMDSSPAVGYVYHNTIVGGSEAAVVIGLKGSKQSYSAPKWHFVNNLVLSKEGFFDQFGGTTPPVDFTAAHNVTTGSRRPWPKEPGRDVGSVYEVAIDHDENGRPVKGSAAMDAGLDLSTYLQGKPLPGCEAGYFRGKAPDAGADEVE